MIFLYVFAIFAVAFLLGTGPALLAGRGGFALLPLAPVFGMALAAALLLDVAPFMSMNTAAFALLLPAILASVGLGVWCRRRTRLGGLGLTSADVTVGAGVSLICALVASTPALITNSLGPFGYQVYDAWLHIAADDWLLHHRLYDQVSPSIAATNFSLDYGQRVITSYHGHYRVGVHAVNAGFAALLGSSPDETSFAFLCVLLGGIAGAVWFGARAARISRPAALLGGLASASAAALTLAYDSALPNSAGIAMAFAACSLLIYGVASNDLRIWVAAGVPLAGLFCVFPEFLAVIGLSAVVFCALTVVVVGLGETKAWFTRNRNSFLVLLSPLPLAFLLAPVGAVRGIHYAWLLLQQKNFMQPPRVIGVIDFFPWLLGMVHVYELDRFDANGLLRVLAVLLSIGLLVLMLVGLFRAGRVWTLATISAFVATTLLGYDVARSNQGGNCGYCEWKVWTFLIPFVALGIGAALDVGFRPGRRIRRSVEWSVLGCLGIWLVVAVSADARVVRDTVRHAARVSPELRAITSQAATVDTGKPILIEGVDASPYGGFYLPGIYELTQQRRRGPTYFAAQTPDDSSYLGVLDPLAVMTYDYDVILSPFPGVRSDRKPLAVHPDYGLFRRAAIDVTFPGQGLVALPATDDHPRIPLIAGPFQAWITTARAARGALMMQFAIPQGSNQRSFTVTEGGAARVVKTGPNSLCVPLSLKRGTAEIQIIPGGASLALAGLEAARFIRGGGCA